MTMKLAAAGRASFLIASLQAAIGIVNAVKMELMANSSRASTCATYQCGKGWQPKSDHHVIDGTPSDEQCCDATCALWTCGPNYLKNSEYDSNVGASDQVCCDRTCKDDFQCPANYTTRGHEARGASTEECCGPICKIFECTDGWLDDESVDKRLGETPEACCAPSCSMFNCSASPGYVTNPDVANIRGNSTATCCNTQCYLLTCPADTQMPEEMNETVGSLSTCCLPLCSQFSCPAGYVKDTSKNTEFGNSTSECCFATCATYSCEGDWANSTSATKLFGINLTDETCCEPSCQAYSCSAGYIPKEGVAADAGKSDEVCCDATCSIYTCSLSSLRKRNETIFNDTRGFTDEICCEPEGCVVFDNRTVPASSTEGCNSFAEDVCDSRYLLFTRNTTDATGNESNTTYAVACQWWGSKGLPICRNTGTPLVGCTVSL